MTSVSVSKQLRRNPSQNHCLQWTGHLTSSPLPSSFVCTGSVRVAEMRHRRQGGGSTQGQEERVVSERLLAQPHHRWAGFWAQPTFQSRKNPGWGKSEQASIPCELHRPTAPRAPHAPRSSCLSDAEKQVSLRLISFLRCLLQLCHFLKHPGGSMLRPTVCHSSNLSPRTLDLSFFKKAENAPSSFISKASSLFMRCQERKLSSGWLAVCANCLPTL